jgi:RNA polymerase sigma-32 factor
LTAIVKEEEIEDMEKRLAYTDVSLEAPLYEEGEDTVMDMIKTDENIEDVIADKERGEILSGKVMEFKKTLNEKEVYIFEKRIMAEEPMTLQEIGAKFKISRERVRQIENKVLNKFKARFKGELKELDL